MGNRRSLKEPQSPQIRRTNLGLKLGEGVVAHYGLGWQLYDFPSPSNLRWVFHTGGAAGFSSHLDFVPQTKTVVAIVSNQDIDGDRPETFIALEIHRRLSGLPVHSLKELIREHQPQEKKPSPPPKKDSRKWKDLKFLIGTYSHPAFGTLDIYAGKGVLELSWYRLRSTLSRISNTTFTVDNVEFLRKFGESRSFEKIEFETIKGQPTLKWQIEPKLEPFYFAKQK